MTHVRGLLIVLTVVISVLGVACRRDAPPQPVTLEEALASELHYPEHWTETQQEAGRLYREGHPEQSLAVLQKVVDANPKFADGHFSLADDYLDMANALERDAAKADQRRTYLEQAAAHYEQFHDLMTNPDDRAQGSDRLVLVHGPKNLKQIDKAVAYARRYADERPTAANGYGMLAAMLRQQGDYAGATAVLVQAASRITASNRNDYDLGQAVIEHVKESPNLDRAAAARFLVDAGKARDRLLADSDSDWRALGAILKDDIAAAQVHVK